MKPFSTTALAILICVLLSACSTPTQETTKIGAVLPLTGWGSYWGEGAQRGAQLAAEDIRAAGGTIELHIEDSQSSATQAASAAQKLTSIDGVQAIYSEFSSLSTPVSPIAQENKALFLYDGFSPELVSSNPYAFKLYLNPAQECEQMLIHAHAKGKQSVALIVLQSGFASPCIEAVKLHARELGITYTVHEVSPDEKDFRTLLTRIKNENAQAILALVYEDHALNILGARESLAMDTPLYCSRSDCYTDSVVEKYGSVIEEGFTFDLKVDPAFAARYLSKYTDAGSTEIQAAATGYDAIQYSYEALKNCPRNDIDCAVQSLTTLRTYDSAIESDNFNTERIQQTRTSYQIFENGRFVEI